MTDISPLQHPDLSHLCNPSSAVCLLKALLVPERIGYIVPSEIAKVYHHVCTKSMIIDVILMAAYIFTGNQ